MATRLDYVRQAETYDQTRSASPSVLRPVLDALAGAPGPRLLDVGGGTGNYALALRERGFEPTVHDLSEPMLARARDKGLPTVRSDATALPFDDASFDAVTLISMIHHVPDWRAALAEAARVLRPDGRLALMAFSREHVEDVFWIVEYFPSTRAWMTEQHPPLAELRAPLPGARVIPLFYEDLEDGSLAALHRRPALLLDPDTRRQTSFWERLEAQHPDELAAGLARLERDLGGGRRPDVERDEARARHGDAVVLAWTKA